MHISPLVRSLLWTAAAFATFFSLMPFLKADQQVEVWSGVLMVGCMLGIWRWGPTAWRAYREGSSNPWHYGVLAIVMIFAFMIFWRIYGVIFVRAGRQDSWTEFPTTAFIVFGFAVAVWLFSLATRLDGERPSRIMGWITAIGAALALFTAPVWPILVSKGGAVIKFFHTLFP